MTDCGKYSPATGVSKLMNEPLDTPYTITKSDKPASVFRNGSATAATTIMANDACSRRTRPKRSASAPMTKRPTSDVMPRPLTSHTAADVSTPSLTAYGERKMNGVK